ncbi:hypothetical protein L2E82_27384 [Cichorium intybus]|uniref:Uncharacterized protein n=1 Tax=Cichorium intybus TaxID=13427 RepID=A0ACB9CT77_CICIN|nr:hypothetical protein L2E82_27384 [Cichorium intybus]
MRNFLETPLEGVQTIEVTSHHCIEEESHNPWNKNPLNRLCYSKDVCDDGRDWIPVRFKTRIPTPKSFIKDPIPPKTKRIGIDNMGHKRPCTNGTKLSIQVLPVTLDAWSDHEIDAMIEVGGNASANSIYEA